MYILNIHCVLVTVIEIHWVKRNYAVNEGEEVELCAQIGSGALGKDVTVALNITYGTGKYISSCMQTE